MIVIANIASIARFVQSSSATFHLEFVPNFNLKHDVDCSS